MPLKLRPAITVVERILHAAKINKQLNLITLKKLAFTTAFLFEDEDIYSLTFGKNKVDMQSAETPSFKVTYSWHLEGTRLTLLRSAHGRCMRRTIHLQDLVSEGK